MDEFDKEIFKYYDKILTCKQVLGGINKDRSLIWLNKPCIPLKYQDENNGENKK